MVRRPAGFASAMTTSGRVLFALSFALVGAFIIAFPGFAPVWPTVPRWAGWHDTLTAVSGGILLAGGIALLVPRTARLAALVLALFLLLRILLLVAPQIAMHPLVEGTWEELGESLIFVAGAWTIFSALPRDVGGPAN